ncbi:DUF3427 domain-containing protein [Sedimentitalea arenosa]|nr:DUF3427 domain-containing protein [Arenibacterium arenosum]
MSEVSQSCEICDGLRVAVSSVAAPRHVASWADLDFSEQIAMLGALGPHMTVGTQITVEAPFGHLVLSIGHQEPPSALYTGGGPAFFDQLVDHIDRSRSVDLAVAFVLESGLVMLEPYFRDLLDRGGRLRLVVGDYLDVSEPAALRRLCDLPGDVSGHVFETAGGSFHPKAWLFRAAGNGGTAIVGSSNLTRTALIHGVEWNLSVSGEKDWEPVEHAFEELLRSPNVKPLTQAWIDAYSARRRRQPLPQMAQAIAKDDIPLPTAAPHEIQCEALAALARARADGKRAGLVVLATGLGKTWLSAFDATDFERVLFVAHREEILTQAMTTFRRIRPEARFGLYSGSAKDEGEILFASIQTLGKTDHLRRFDPEAFDYIVVDEFHHASAATYRRLIEHFRPRFLLGLTATPDRTDGADLLALCDDTLVYRCDLAEGISRGFLSPFRYFGVPDDIDYAQIPWRSTRFDEEALTTAVATQARAQNALEQLWRHGDGPAIGFCVSRRHAEFMAEFFRNAGLRSVAVHSGEGSAPRTSSLEALGAGELDILFAVDMFNEGVDVPQIGTVLMLRPTESAILFLQQLGRGLRRIEGKVLRVIDYIGNHRTFLTKARALLSAGDGDRALSQRLDLLVAGELDLPEGCEITYDLKALDFLRSMLATTGAQDEAEAWYRVHLLRHGRRPTALEFAQAGFSPARTGHGGWFEFVRDMGDEVPASVLGQAGLMRALERPALPCPAGPALMSSLIAGGSVSRQSLHAAITAAIPASSQAQPITRDDFEEATSHWLMTPFVVEHKGKLAVRGETGPVVSAAVDELATWRIVSASDAGPRRQEIDEAAQPFGAPAIWHEYMREDIPPLFGETFNPGSWNSGIVKTRTGLVLLTTLNKGSLAQGNHYEDHFLSDRRMQWQSQTSTKQNSERGRILSRELPNKEVHLFVRSSKLRGKTAAPFTYLGKPRFVNWEGERPITIEWELPEPVPAELHRAFGIG